MNHFKLPSIADPKKSTAEYGNIATLTLIRIALIPLFVVVFYLPYPWARPAAAIIFSLAGITDWLDGYLARKLGQTSAFGAFLDPVADKLMVAVALVLIVHTDPRLPIALSAAVIIGREIAISALREWMAEIGRRSHVAVSPIGKIKTIVQITALIMLIFKVDLLFIPMYETGYFLIMGAAALTLWSMVTYLTAAWRSLEGLEIHPGEGPPHSLDRPD
jgi:CDP-diacylglycerol--glycerol-3-phosphate 3-phosphatidyltransferase